MSRDSIDGIRLQKLLGGVELANLRQRLRARYERGASRDEFTLTDLLGHERRALAGLLGRRAVAAGSMRIRRSELDAALDHAGIAVTLREALEFLDGPLSDRRADRVAREQAWSAALSLTAEPRLRHVSTSERMNAARKFGADPRSRARRVRCSAIDAPPGHSCRRTAAETALPTATSDPAIEAP